MYFHEVLRFFLQSFSIHMLDPSSYFLLAQSYSLLPYLFQITASVFACVLCLIINHESLGGKYTFKTTIYM